MTREERHIAVLNRMLENMDVFDSIKPTEERKRAIKEAIKALEQDPILDKIKAEITDTGAYEQETMGQTAFLNGINYCLGVIDKYRGE